MEKSAPGWFAESVRWSAVGIEAVGVAIMVLGSVLALVLFVRGLGRADVFEQGWRDLRQNLGRAILLGLEFLVAADIIRTVAIEPTLRSLAVLAGIVVVRTFLSFALEVELNGHWPWHGTRHASGRNASG